MVFLDKKTSDLCIQTEFYPELSLLGISITQKKLSLRFNCFEKYEKK